MIYGCGINQSIDQLLDIKNRKLQAKNSTHLHPQLFRAQKQFQKCLNKNR